MKKMGKSKLIKRLETQTYRLYDWLKENAVGYENRKSAKEIIYALPDLFTSRQLVEEAIQQIRVHFDRKVGSSPRGYWLMCTDDKINGQSYMTQQAISKMKVAILAGVDPKIFYNALNEIKPQYNNTIDKQQRLTFSDYEKSEISRYSDDIRG